MHAQKTEYLRTWVRKCPALLPCQSSASSSTGWAPLASCASLTIRSQATWASSISFLASNGSSSTSQLSAAIQTGFSVPIFMLADELSKRSCCGAHCQKNQCIYNFFANNLGYIKRINSTFYVCYYVCVPKSKHLGKIKHKNA